MNGLILISIFLPILLGTGMLFSPERWFGRKQIMAYTIGGLFVTALVVIIAVTQNNDMTLKLFSMTDQIEIAFRIDDLGKLFSVMIILIWLLAAIFSYDYMKQEEHQKRYFGFYLVTAGILIGLSYAKNLVTMYLFYELMTVLSMPLVIHTESHEAIMAALKYMIYSFAGAYGALFGIFFLNQYLTTMDFVPGGSLNMTAIAGKEELILIVVFCMILGFGVKAGCFPMHAWLPTAHPVAPSPASAVLSGLIVKGGVLAIIRVVFYLVGADFLRGSWVQNTWMILSLITVFMGSMLAYREPVLKKRLAYSTVSQLSYILFGLSLLNPLAATGSLLHVVFHAVIKSALFLSAGAFISRTGKKQVSDLRGIGKIMPLTLTAYTFVSLGLIGIPPFSGFISKWYLAQGSLETGIAVFSWLGPVILLVSALLTAGYLLPPVIIGFLPGEAYSGRKMEKKENIFICLPLVILALATLYFGIWPAQIADLANAIVATWF